MKHFTLSFLLLFIIHFSFAQNQELLLKKGRVELSNNSTLIKTKNFENALYQDAYYVVLGFEGIPSEQEQINLKNQGVDLLHYIPNNAYWAKVERSSFSKMNWRKGINSISILENEYKYDPIMDQLGDRLLAYVVFQENIEENEAKEILDGQYMKWEKHHPSMVKIFASKEQLKNISSFAIVNYISPTFEGHDELISQNIETHRIKNLTHASGLNLTGNGVMMCVGDGGTIEKHVDLENRILNENSIATSNHGSNVTGIICAEGLLDPDGKGIATQTQIIAEYYSNVIFNTAFYTLYGAVLSNNSYSGNVMSNACLEAGTYTAEARHVDESLKTLNQVTHVFASGNDGDQDCSTDTGYPAGYRTIRNAWNSAKNTLTVGATDHQNVIASYSSRGPTEDGRVKPEIVATGSAVYSASSYNNYSQGNGTSYSTPTVSGTLALLYEHYRNLNSGTDPNGDLMKAIVCNTADDQGNEGPDFLYGYGSLNAYRAVNTVTNAQYFTGSIANGIQDTHVLTLPNDANQLKVMLYWHDEEALIGANSSIVNNLDLSISDGMTTSFPYILDHSPANCTNPATTGLDSVNNMEQVVIDNPSAGTYTILIDGKTIPLGVQNYVIVYDIIEDHLTLSSPLGGEIFEPNETVNITWEASGFDSNDFTLEYTLDNGSSWNNIATGVSGTDRNYLWTIPAVISDQAKVRVTWDAVSGLPSTESASTFTIIDNPNSINIAPDCDNNIVLTWSASTGASEYEVLEFTGGTYTVIATTTSTSYTATGLTNGQEYIYAVRAKTASGIVSENPKPKSALAMGTASGPIATFPYFQDFENGAGDWFSDGKNDSWELTTPANTIIDRACEGDMSWVTNANGNYDEGSKGYLYSPCFDLSTMTNPVLSLAMIYQIEDSNDGYGATYYDYLQAQYSTDGRNWTNLGTNGAGHNWYNNYVGAHVWDDEKDYWHSASFAIPVTASRINFRFLMYSDGFTEEEGAAIDNILIYEDQKIYPATTTSLGNTQAVSGSDWVHFDVSGDRLVSIQPNGNDLGNVTVDGYINTAGIRNDGAQYYLDRNWKITSDHTPTNNVKVRLYYLDSEVEALRTASGCAHCSTLNDAFLSGVTQYSGINENGDLADNDSSGFLYHLPENVSVVPYDTGYYVEFEVTSFSEFYINGGDCGSLDGFLCEPCDMPTNFVVDLGNDPNKVNLSWDAVENVNTYQIRYRRALTTTWSHLIANATNKNINNLVQNKVYDYRVRSKCSDGTWSELSTIDKFRTVQCLAPLNTIVTQINNSRVKIEWDQYTYADKYQIFYREQGTNDWSKLVTYLPGMNFRVLNNLTSGITYEYKVRSFCEVSYGPFSELETFMITSSRENQVSDLSSVQVFPNPVLHDLNVEMILNKKEEIVFTIYDVYGKTVYNNKVIMNQGFNQRNIILTSEFTTGQYFMKITNGNTTEIIKFIKQ